jgi:hypothetical protein
MFLASSISTMAVGATGRPPTWEEPIMNILRSRRARLATLGIGLVAASAAAMSHPAAATASCTFHLRRVEAVRIQEKGIGKGDEIYLIINGERVPASGAVFFPADGTSRSASAFGDTDATNEGFVGSMKVKMWEQDPGFDEKIGPTGTVNCTGDQTDQVLPFEEPGSASYKLHYDVTFVSG